MALVQSVFVLVAAFLAVQGVNISPSKVQERGKLFSGAIVYPDITINDPRCTKNGLFPNPDDCTSYYACVDGTSQKRKCPEEMRYDSRRSCTLEEDADCGVRPLGNKDEADYDCPEYYGIFPFPSDCHKYVVCIDNVPSVRKCPESQWYQDNTGCVEGDTCPALLNAVRRNELTDLTGN